MATSPNNDAQPEEKIEKNHTKSLLIASLLCCSISISISFGVTYLLIKAERIDIAEFTNQIEKQSEKVPELEVAILDLNSQIKNLTAENEVLRLYLRHSSATALKNILIDQEENFQTYLKNMKMAMNDLSKTIPRTNDWNNEYQYKLDIAQKKSLQREDLLRILKTGEPNEKTSANN